ncbi:MAG: chemotaxis protein CheX, partial [Sulfurimonas denitrificans]|nr:chemotaxis protein CheX [Sulfurimonas denitrificans]
DKCKLIFTDKLSTKEDISMVSGVGIGMGVIKENLEKLDAKYTIENIPQSGVTFTFYIPLNINRDEDISNEKKIENICDNILTQIEVFLKNSLKLEIKSIKQITDVSIDKSYAQIDLYDTFDGNVIMLFSDEIIEFMSSALIPKNFDKTDIAWMSKELPSEVLNTIVGLSLQYFDKSLKDVKMTPPLYLDNTDLTKALKDAKNKFIQEIETSSGKIVYIVFEKEKP